MNARNASPAIRLALGGELTIASAAAVREQLLAALRNDAPLDIDLSAVDEFDSAGMQLLLAAKKSAELTGKALRLTHPSRAITDVLALFGLTDSLIEETETPQ